MANLLSTTITGNLTVDTNILYVDSTNNRVGIGTTSPANEILHVAGNIMMDGSILRMASSTTKLVLQNVGGSWNSLSAKGINIGDWNSDPSYGDILVGNYDFSIKKDDLTSLLRVKNNGNVLIGTTTDSGNKLEVNGSIRGTSIIKNGGTSLQYLKADGSVDTVTATTDFVRYGDFINYPTFAGKTVTMHPSTIKTLLWGGEGIRYTVTNSYTGTYPQAGSTWVRTYELIDGTNSVYSSGNVYLGFWTNRPPANVTVRVQNTSGTWYGPYSGTEIRAGGSCTTCFAYWRIPCGGPNYIKKWEITLTPQDGYTINLQTVDIVIDNNEGIDQSPFVGRGGSSIYGTLSFKGTGSATTAYINNSGGMYLAGNLGIGTSSPSSKLDVRGNAFIGDGTNNNYLRVYHDSAAEYVDVHGYGLEFSRTSNYIRPNTDNNKILYVGFNEASLSWSLVRIDSVDTVFYSSGIESVRINSSGNVGIGTTSPAEKLHISSGQIQIGDSSSNFFGIRLSRTNTAVVQDAHLYSPSNNSPSVFYIEGGYYNSEAAGTVTAANSGYAYYERYFGNGAANSYKHLGFINVANGNFTSTNLVSSITMLSNGNVGIGTTSPVRSLHVKKTGDNEVARFESDQTTSYIELEDANTTGQILIGTQGDNFQIHTAGAERLRITGTGNVGIGTTAPLAKVDISAGQEDVDLVVRNAGGGYRAGIALYGGTADISRIWQDDGDSAKLHIGYSSAYNTTLTPRITMTTSGNVGIGTTNPSYQIEVNNTVNENLARFYRTNSATSISHLVSTGRPQTRYSYDSQQAWYIGNNIGTFGIGTGYLASTAPILNITSAGNVGIGTTSPTSLLHIAYGGGAPSGLYVKSSTNRSKLLVADNDSSAYVIAEGTKASYGTADSLSTSNLTIDTSGNVGIGTTSPDSLLEIENTPAAQSQTRMLSLDNNPTSNQGSGYIEISSGSNNQAKTQIEQVSSGGFGLLGNQYIDTNIINRGLSAAAHGNINFATGSSTSATSIVMTIGGGTQKGKVGIGTTSPGYRLTVHEDLGTGGTLAEFKNSNATYSQNLYLSFNSSKDVTWSQGSGAGGTVFNTGTRGHSFQINGTTNVVFNSLGNVGIGTTGPSEKLTVSGNLSLDGVTRKLYFDTTGSAKQIILGVENDYQFHIVNARGNSSRFVLGNTDISLGTSSVKLFYISTSTGNVGIGTTSPGNLLHIVATSNNSSALIVQDDARRLQLGRDMIEARSADGLTVQNLYIQPNGNVGIATSSGNVGIGTTSPTAKLHVNGDIKLSDNQFLTWNTSNTRITGQSGYLQLQVAASDVMRLTSSGNVGIGTTSPSALLHVNKGIIGEVARLGAGNYQLTFGVTTTYGEIQAVEQGVAYRNLLLNRSGGNVLIGTTTDNGKKLQVNGDVFIKGSGSASSTKIFEVQNSNGTSIMDFRGDAYAFFGCGQGGGAASGFIFRYNDTAHVQFTGYNYGNGAGSYKPILLDTDLVGRGQGIYVNFGGTGYANPAPLGSTEFAVRGRTSDATENVMELRDSNNTEKFVVKNDGAIVTNGNMGWSGTVSFPSNPPGQQNLEFTNGILTNVF